MTRSGGGSEYCDDGDLFKRTISAFRTVSAFIVVFFLILPVLISVPYTFVEVTVGGTSTHLLPKEILDTPGYSGPVFGPNEPGNGSTPPSNNTTSPDTLCYSPPTGYTCVGVVLPQSGSTYLGTVDFGGTIVTTDQQVYALLNSKIAISVHSFANGYGFSFWGSSPTGISIAQFEQGSTTATIASVSSLYLNVYKTSSGADITFNVLYSNVSNGVSAGQILLENHAFTQGQSTWLTAGQAYSVMGQNFVHSPDFLRGYVFSQWASRAGTLGNLTQQTTTFTPSEGGTLSMLVNATSGDWGGYMYSGSSITSASARFVLPSFGQQNGATIIQLGFWVGIGGANGKLNLWQAGIVVTWGNQQLTLHPFWEQVGSSCKGCPPHTGSQAAYAGDTVDVAVTASGGMDTYSVNDVTQSWSFSGTVHNFLANDQTAEWLAECSTCSSNNNPPTPMYPFPPATVESPKLNGQAVTFAGPMVDLTAYYGTGSSLIAATFVIPDSNYSVFHLTGNNGYHGYG